MGLMNAFAGLAQGLGAYGQAADRTAMLNLQQEQQRLLMDRYRAEDERRRRAEMQQGADNTAILKAINPMGYAEAQGDMGNRPTSFTTPSAGTQMSLYNIAEAKRKEQEAADYQKRAAFATSWAAKRGYVTDPTGEKFMAQVGYNPFEFEGVSNIIAKAEEKEAQRQWQEQMKQEGWTQAQILAGMRGGGDGNVGTWSLTPDGRARMNNKTGEIVQLGETYARPSAGQSPSGESPQFLPIDTTARKNLASWVEQANDAARVISTLESAMGKSVDPKTGQVTFKEQPSSPFAGGTGLFLGMLPDRAAARVDPEGIPMRSAIAGFSSQIMNALSGANVTETEKKRLEAFLPTSNDSWPTLREKMYGYREYLREKGASWGDTYGEHEVLKRGLGALDGPSMVGGGGGWGNDLPEGFKELP